MFSTLDQSIGLLTNQTSRRIVRHVNSKLEAYDITLEQWIVLLTLSEQEGISQKHLAEKVDKDQPTVARILDILERKELAERRASKEDRRSFSVHITNKGINLKEKVVHFLEDIFLKMLKGISQDKIDIYKEVLMEISKNIMMQYEEEK